VVAVVSHVLKGLDVEEAILALALLVLLLVSRRQFYAQSDPRSRWIAARIITQLLILATLFGLTLLFAYRGRVIGQVTLSDRLQHVLLGLIGVHGPIQFRGDGPNDVITATLLGFGVLTSFVTVYLLLRPVQPLAKPSDLDEDRLRRLLSARGGRDSLSYFALRPDKCIVWSPTGKAGVAHRVLHGVALASGDPIGDPEAWPAAIEAFLTLADRYAWVPAVIGCSEAGATAFNRVGGLDALELGDEAIVSVSHFSLQGRPMKAVRQAVARVERAGYTSQVRRAGEVSASEWAELRLVASAWRGSQVERGFSMVLSRLGDPSDPDCVLVTAHQSGKLRGLLHFVPWGSDGLSLDSMRRDRAAENGLNEFLIVALIQAAEKLGAQRLSLNFAVFRASIERGERIGAGPVLRIWHSVLHTASRWWQIESLYRFNAKFRPTWHTRYVSFPRSRDLPRIAFAALQAEGFLPDPASVRRRFLTHDGSRTPKDPPSRAAS
jgi:lysyl-tRNA synthetase, class II